MKTCKICACPLAENKLRCPVCKTWNVAEAAKEFRADEDDGTMLLSCAKSAEATRVNTGFLDRLWGGGLVVTSTTILAGEPGAGKSTIALQVTDFILKPNPAFEALYVAAEENVEEIKSRADRIAVSTADRIRMVPALQGVEDLAGIIMRRKPSFIILDSLNDLAGGNQNAMVELCKVSKQYATLLKSPVIIISHINGEGDIAGVMDLQHAVDTCMLFSTNNPWGYKDLRSLEVEKNRFGPAHLTEYFAMTAKGLVRQDEKELEQAAEDEED